MSRWSTETSEAFVTRMQARARMHEERRAHRRRVLTVLGLLAIGAVGLGVLGEGARFLYALLGGAR